VSRLDEAAVKARLAGVPHWRRAADTITRTWQLADFVAALAFVNRVGALAEAAGHHPDIDIRYNKVTLILSTHDAGGLTASDFDLAQHIDADPLARR
jgi:4a-hydroxytetrahydrobiopterin dehydratase